MSKWNWILYPITFIKKTIMLLKVESNLRLSPIEFAKLDPGDHVKVSAQCSDGVVEHFWVHLSDVNQVDGSMSGYVDNDLKFTDDHGYKINDYIEFNYEHVESYLQRDIQEIINKL